MSWGIPGSAFLPPPIPGQSIQAPMQVPKAIRRVGEQAFWSSFRYPATTGVATTTDRLFTTPQGQQGQGFGVALSIADTNLKEGGRIPAQFAFTVDGIACQAYYQDNSPVVHEDIANVQNQCVLRWDFIQTQFEIAPAILVGAGGGIFGTTADTGAADGGNGSRTALNNGNGQLWVYRQMPVLLPSNSTFAIQLAWGSNATAIDGGSTHALQTSLILRVSLLGRFQTAIAVG